MEGTKENKQKRRFSKKQLRASQGMLTQQAKTNIYASQKGMTGFGAVRHGKDIKADNVCADSHGVLTQQAATNIYASQKGMTGFGAVRHGRDIRADDACPEGQGLLTQIAKTNVYASQKGMTTFGAVRHGKDIKILELYEEGNDDEYPTDEDEPTKVKPSWRHRDEEQDDQPREALAHVPTPEPVHESIPPKTEPVHEATPEPVVDGPGDQEPDVNEESEVVNDNKAESEQEYDEPQMDAVKEEEEENDFFSKDEN